MKKNLQGAIVIFFVTFAFLLALNELTNDKDSLETQEEQYYSNIE